MADKPKAEKKLAGSVQKIVEEIEKLTVVDLSNLVKVLEEKFGVSAQPMAMAQAPMASQTPGAPAAGAQAVPEQSEFDVILVVLASINSGCRLGCCLARGGCGRGFLSNHDYRYE